MEKNLKRVQRWIERCIAACRSEKWDSALAEVECARAELESASEEIWQRASGSDDPHRAGQFVGLSLRSLAVALLVIMVAAIPISTRRCRGHQAVAPRVGHDRRAERPFGLEEQPE